MVGIIIYHSTVVIHKNKCDNELCSDDILILILILILSDVVACRDLSKNGIKLIVPGSLATLDHLVEV